MENQRVVRVKPGTTDKNAVIIEQLLGHTNNLGNPHQIKPEHLGIDSTLIPRLKSLPAKQWDFYFTTILISQGINFGFNVALDIQKVGNNIEIISAGEFSERTNLMMNRSLPWQRVSTSKIIIQINALSNGVTVDVSIQIKE